MAVVVCRFVILLGLISAVPAPAAGKETSPHRPEPYRTTVSVGFSHWYGGTFGAPIGTYTPGLTLGLVLADWAELQLAYSISVVDLTLPDETPSRVGFLTLAVLLRRELEVAGERLMFGGGIVGGVVHTKNGVREAFGGAIVARYLIAVTRSVAIGPFLDVRALLYRLPESDLAIYRIEDDRLEAGHSDAHVQIGAAVAF